MMMLLYGTNTMIILLMHLLSGFQSIYRSLSDAKEFNTYSL